MVIGKSGVWCCYYKLVASNTLSNENIKLFDDSKTAVIAQRTENKTQKDIFVRQNNSMRCSASNEQTSRV